MIINKDQEISLAEFLERFPELELPVTLTDEAQLEFSRNNQPLTELMIAQYIAIIETDPIDEFTEFVPCFRIAETLDFHGVVYWKGGLMNYQYILATISKEGELIDRAVIAGTFSDGASLVQSVATIEEDWIIYIVSGKSSSNHKDYDASTSKTFDLELLTDGQIITSS